MTTTSSRHYVDRWANFCYYFVANYQSLSNKLAQSCDLKSIMCNNDESLRSFLKCFMSMRNRILDVAKVAMIEDFYHESNDSTFIRAILHKAPVTLKQLF